MFYAIPNLTSSTAFEVAEPWAYVPGDLPPKDITKESMIQWASGVAVNYAAISGYEGISPEVRITSDNPAHMLHAFIADYDLPLPADAIQRIMDNPVCEFKPAYISRTASGNARMVWLLETPFLCGSKSHMKDFLKLAAKHMKLDKWLGGFDAAAFGDVTKYYLLGTDWTPLFPDYKVPAVHTQLWFFKAAAGAKFDENKTVEYQIPYEDLEKEVHSRFPGRWNGAFVAGARGVRFWDASADNPTAAMVTPDGMVCYTGDQFFVPWKQLFGSAFVDNYEASYVAEVVDHCVYDGREFWMEDDGNWHAWNKQDFTQQLRVKGRSGKCRPGQTASEIDVIENSIKQNRRVFGALPFLYHPTGMLRYNQKPYLNIATVKPCAPGAPVTPGKLAFSDGRKHFPFIYQLLVSMFTDEQHEDAEQLIALLAWIKHFYVNSLERTPKSGHLLIIAGPPGKGKSMFVNEVLGNLMGAAPVDGTGLLLEGERWTDEVAESPVMLIDDAVATSDFRGMKKFTARIKKYVANSKITWEKKYKSGGAVPWFGRIVILCNTDPESLKILPDPDSSTLDKFSMLLASEAKMKFPSREEITRTVRQELPYFARFLADWEIPERWEAEETRFGVRPFHHKALLEESRQQGVGAVLEMLDGFMQVYTEGGMKKEWRGTASHLFEDLSAYRPESMRSLKERALSTQLGILSKNGYSLYKTRNERGLQEWVISKHVTAIQEKEEA